MYQKTDFSGFFVAENYGVGVGCGLGDGEISGSNPVGKVKGGLIPSGKGSGCWRISVGF